MATTALYYLNYSLNITTWYGTPDFPNNTCCVAPRSAYFAAGTPNGGTGPGVNGVDFILYVTSEDTGCTPLAQFQANGGTQAYASYCNQDQATGRPLAGMTNW